MENLPFFLDTEEAIDHYKNHHDCTDAVKSYIVGLLHTDGFKNSDIRAALEINKVYLVTHLKRAGTSLSETELTLWHNNPRAITLGHVRAIAKLPRSEREELLRSLLTGRQKGDNNKSVSKYESLANSLAKGESVEKDANIKKYEELMQATIGKVVRIKYNQAKQSGSITVDFFSLDSLDDISKSLGFDASKHM